MKKTLYTLTVDGYEPEICALTHPLMRRWADKIGADFHVIKTRVYPKLSPVMEKLQIYELAKERGDDWAIYLDSDALIHPDTMDITEVVSRDTVFHNGVDFAACRYEYDDYFRRDGRHIASCNWFTAASSWCLDLWKPLDDLTYEQAVKQLRPTAVESNRDPAHFVDDFILSRNIARYGLKCVTFRELLAKVGQVDSQYLWHEYTMTGAEKLATIKKILGAWTGQVIE